MDMGSVTFVAEGHENLIKQALHQFLGGLLQ